MRVNRAIPEPKRAIKQSNRAIPEPKRAIKRSNRAIQQPERATPTPLHNNKKRKILYLSRESPLYNRHFIKFNKNRLFINYKQTLIKSLISFKMLAPVRTAQVADLYTARSCVDKLVAA